jgi:HAD superfamily hydrolase (TIGR01509 family)
LTNRRGGAASERFADVGAQAVFFDLDYTLYDQAEYMRGALRSVAERVACESFAAGRDLTRSLLALWRTVGTDCGHLFDGWLERHGLFSWDRLESCVTAFHDYRPAHLTLYPGVDRTLRRLRRAYQLGIVTDGHADMQRTKIRALGLEGRVDTIVYCAELSRSKPDPEVFHHAARTAGVAPPAAVFVGDHPVRDILGARWAGMRTVRVMSGEFQYLPDYPGAPAHDRLRSVRGLPGLLASARLGERGLRVIRAGTGVGDRLAGGGPIGDSEGRRIARPLANVSGPV